MIIYIEQKKINNLSISNISSKLINKENFKSNNLAEFIEEKEKEIEEKIYFNNILPDESNNNNQYYSSFSIKILLYSEISVRFNDCKIILLYNLLKKLYDNRMGMQVNNW